MRRLTLAVLLAAAAPALTEEIRFKEFASTFSMLGEAAESFRRFFRPDRPTHQDLLAFARNPAGN